MTAPLIGISTHGPQDAFRAELDELLAGIVSGVERTGGLPLLIPYGLGGAALRGVFARLDGLLLTGGGDLDPAHYGMEQTELVKGIDPARDTQEIQLARWVIADDKPFFGICRGAQVFNAALGGTLYRDVSEHPGVQRHEYGAEPSTLRPHPVQIREETALARAVGLSVLTVNSMHHQAVRALAPGLRVAANAPDGLIEAYDAPDRRFVLGVQWHPEALLDDADMLGLFQALVRAAAPHAH